MTVPENGVRLCLRDRPGLYEQNVMAAVGFCVDGCGLCSSPTAAARHSYSSGWVGCLGHSGTDEKRSRTIVKWKR